MYLFSISILYFLIGIIGLIPVQSFYQNDSNVVQLTSSNFNQLVTKSKDIWLVQFYAPWCPHSKRSAPIISKAARMLKGKVRFGAVDCQRETKLAEKYQITGYPVEKFFKGNKNEIYYGPETVQGFISEALDFISRN